MNIHYITCSEPWFTDLYNGKKKVEGREGLDIYRKIKVGDKILFQSEISNKQFVAKVIKIENFRTVEEYLHHVHLESALPGVHDFEEGCRIYYQWYDPKEVEQYGFLGIWVLPES